MSRPPRPPGRPPIRGTGQQRVVGALDAVLAHAVDIHEAQDLGGKGGPTGGATAWCRPGETRGRARPRQVQRMHAGRSLDVDPARQPGPRPHRCSASSPARRPRYRGSRSEAGPIGRGHQPSAGSQRPTRSQSMWDRRPLRSTMRPRVAGICCACASWASPSPPVARDRRPATTQPIADQPLRGDAATSMTTARIRLSVLASNWQLGSRAGRATAMAGGQTMDWRSGPMRVQGTRPSWAARASMVAGDCACPI